LLEKEVTAYILWYFTASFIDHVRKNYGFSV
jgi:hypothetical protein